MAKIVYNGDYGGFGLSDKAVERYAELKGLKLDNDPDDEGYAFWKYSDTDEYFDKDLILRHDPCLVQVVEELGSYADTNYSDLCIREVPDGSRYYIHEYDGREYVVLESEQKWETA